MKRNSPETLILLRLVETVPNAKIFNGSSPGNNHKSLAIFGYEEGKLYCWVRKRKRGNIYSPLSSKITILDLANPNLFDEFSMQAAMLEQFGDIDIHLPKSNGAEVWPRQQGGN